ncbi:hypothetical protein BUALT_Bualt07G0090900 [Buddleja alternifolia]|uniref:SWIM-type domain-containing protein n=1 Tax=Buddleja alternifolia TaxID=168488 RepID=A0AAV6X9H6_9LAMI|nr:hypothetical protein BUALT_Bualt07G0090900 [Buddleja alternifolia]
MPDIQILCDGFVTKNRELHVYLVAKFHELPINEDLPITQPELIILDPEPQTKAQSEPILQTKDPYETILQTEPQIQSQCTSQTQHKTLEVRKDGENLEDHDWDEICRSIDSTVLGYLGEDSVGNRDEKETGKGTENGAEKGTEMGSEMETEVGPDMDRDRDTEREVDSEDSDAECNDFWDSDYMDSEVEGKTVTIPTETAGAIAVEPIPPHIVEKEPSSDSEGEESEDLVNNGDNFSSGKDSDNEGGEQDIIFNPRDKYDPPFELGMLFSTKDEFKCSVNNHAVKTRRSLEITKNDCRRMYARCVREGCNWRINALKVLNECSFQIREYYPKHKCGRSYDVKNVNSRWLSGKYENAFRNDPKRNAKGFRQDVVQKIRCTVTKSQAYRAKRKALKAIEGLIPAFELVFPRAENSCVRHLHENFKKAKFRGLTFKLALWNAAKATTLPEYELRMKEMALLDQFAVEWFNDKPPSQWSRSHFQTFPKCDMLLNNLCESFNSSILEAREKPILTMLEWIKEYLMTTLTENRDKAKKRWSYKQICPKIKKIIEKNMEKSADCIPLKSDDWNYEIKVCDGDRLTVKLRTHSCSCRRCDLTGIPCSHAMSAIGCQVLEPDDFVHESYSVATYLAVYSHAISPVNGPKLWEKTGYIPPMPPNFGKKRGRPARARRLGADEPRDKGRRGKERKGPVRLKKQSFRVQCHYCGNPSHNQIGCNRRKTDIAAGLTRDFAAPININIENASGNDAGPSKRTKVPPQKRKRCAAQKGTTSVAKQALTPEYDNGDPSTPASTQESTAHSRTSPRKRKGQKAASSQESASESIPGSASKTLQCTPNASLGIRSSNEGPHQPKLTARKRTFSEVGMTTAE